MVLKMTIPCWQKALRITCDHAGGFLGVAQAFFGIFEPQGRAALHMHALVWTLINAELIARCSKRQLEFLCIVIGKVIAS